MVVGSRQYTMQNGRLGQQAAAAVLMSYREIEGDRFTVVTRSGSAQLNGIIDKLLSSEAGAVCRRKMPITRSLPPTIGFTYWAPRPRSGEVATRWHYRLGSRRHFSSLEKPGSTWRVTRWCGWKASSPPACRFWLGRPVLPKAISKCMASGCPSTCRASHPVFCWARPNWIFSAPITSSIRMQLRASDVTATAGNALRCPTCRWLAKAIRRRRRLSPH